MSFLMFFSTFEKRGREWVEVEILCHFSISVLIMNALVWIIKTNCLVTIHGNLYVIFIDFDQCETTFIFTHFKNSKTLWLE